MTVESRAIIRTDVALVTLNVGVFAWVRADMRDVRSRMQILKAELCERMAKLESRSTGRRSA